MVFKRRHNEITFGISSKSFVETYIGGEIQPEEILRIKGRDLTDDEIEELKSSNPFTQGYILCSDCEKRLSILEGRVERKVFSKLRNHKVINTSSYDIVEETENELMRLFIYSLAWRAAIVQINDFQMEEKHKEILRIILNTNLNLEEQELANALTKNSEDIIQYPLIITISEVIGENNNYVYCSHSLVPYGMILNDLSFQLFFKEKHVNTNESLQGVNRIISKREIYNINEGSLKIAVISNEKRLCINQNLAHYIADKVMRRGGANFREGFKKIFGKKAPEGLVNYFKFQVAYNTNDQVENYTVSHFFEVAVKVMIEYCHSIGIRLRE